MYREKDVLFVGYKVPHPLTHSISVKIQTTGHRKPKEVLNEAINSLIEELSALEVKFISEVDRIKSTDNDK